jgi:uncharacterized protein (DUF1684 family)
VTSLPQSARTALDVASWRREVHDLYEAARGSASPADGHALWVAGRSAMFRDHPATARLADQELEHAAYDPAFRFSVQIEPAEEGSWEYATGTDGIAPFRRIGRVTLGDLGSLDVWWLETYGGGVFVPFKDATNGQSTYGAGRYVLDTVKGSDLGRMPGGEWVVDLNFAYNPSCVYSARWSCPLAPRGNVLTGAAPVGELMPDYGTSDPYALD